MRIQKKQRVVVSCVAFETVRVTKPIEYLDADKVYLLYWTKSSHPEKRKIYKDFINEVIRILKKEQDIKPELVEIPVYLFAPVLKELIPILNKERKKGNQVYVNISAGPPSYGAAAMVACMMENAIPFSVPVNEFMVSEEAYYGENGKPIGIAKEVKDPDQLLTFPLKTPPQELVRALTIFREKKEKKLLTTYNSMIDALKEKNLMKRKIKRKKKDEHSSNLMFYRRHYIDKWLQLGWVKESEDGELVLTPAGEMITEVFFHNGNFN